MRYQHPDGISWCDWSSNPLKVKRKDNRKVGWACVKISDGCSECYASDINVRFGTHLEYNKPNLRQVEWWLDEREFTEWKTKAKPGDKIFVADMTDMFLEEIPKEFVKRIFFEMEQRKDLTFQILTKRPERMKQLLEEFYLYCHMTGLPSNIWLGVSVENKKVFHRLTTLYQIPSKIHFASFEPLLESLCPGLDLSSLEWVIVGAESGPKHRSFNIQWAREIQDLCRINGVAFWFKQGSDRFPGQHEEALDGRIHQDFPKI